jgi:hypothetical protein
MTIHLDAELIRFAELRRRLLELYPEVDDQTLADTLEGATNLREALSAIIRSALEDECLAKALKERIDAMKQRLSRFEDRADTKRRMVLQAMEETDIRKIMEPDFTASSRLAPPSVEILDECAVPMEFLVPQPHKLDKRALLAALNAGVEVSGAVIAPPRVSLSIRSL